MLLTKFKTMLEEKDLGWCLRRKKTFRYQLDENLVPVEAVW